MVKNQLLVFLERIMLLTFFISYIRLTVIFINEKYYGNNYYH
jgi:hypothetical protein